LLTLSADISGDVLTYQSLGTSVDHCAISSVVIPHGGDVRLVRIAVGLGRICAGHILNFGRALIDNGGSCGFHGGVVIKQTPAIVLIFLWLPWQREVS